MTTTMTESEFKDNLAFFGWRALNHIPHRFDHPKCSHHVYNFNSGRPSVMIQKYNAGSDHYKRYEDALVAIANITPGFRDSDHDQKVQPSKKKG